MSTMREQRSSKKRSVLPPSSFGRSTATLRAGAKGMVSGRMTGGGNMVTIGDWSSSGSQSSHLKMALERSQIGSDNEDHLEGHGDAPKVRRRHMIRSLMPPVIIHINDFAAALALVWLRR